MIDCMYTNTTHGPIAMMLQDLKNKSKHNAGDNYNSTSLSDMILSLHNFLKRSLDRSIHDLQTVDLNFLLMNTMSAA